ncbi:MAG TPA: SMP-30/gluconolactonase/LRE family protein, partial [Gaiellaceae bacterium]|nr:SMP-30/gluconolactonase/LRE family protein [Gaiellaceae bacterium]
ELLPGRPDAIVDLQTPEGVALVGGQWRYADARVEKIDFVEVGSPEDPLGPGTIPNRTYDVVRDGDWRELAPEETQHRLANGRVCFNWYEIDVTLPEQLGDLDVAGTAIVFEVAIDDYAEVWVNGKLPFQIGDRGGHVVGGFNVPNRVLLTRDARPGETFTISVFGINGPISASPHNYIWMRTATLDVYAPGRATAAVEVPLEVSGDLSGILPDEPRLARVAGGFEFTEGPVWARDGALLFSSPNTNAIYRWTPDTETVSVFRAKSGYTGVDVGRYHQPGSNGLTLSPDGLLTICQHGNRRVIRVNPHGDVTVLADRFEGKRLNSPNDLVYRSDGTLFFTDPPFGLPDPADSELAFSGVYRVRDGEVSLLTSELLGPNGLAFSPDERWLYVGNWDFDRIVVMRYDPETGEGSVFFDMTSPDAEDAIDGIKVDLDGNLYVCGPGGIWVLSPAGEHLGTLALPETPHNLAWGGDGHDLYITALTSVYRLRVATKGATP